MCGVRGGEEGVGGGPQGSPAREGDEETGTQEDGEDAQVLDGVVDADVLVTRAEGVLDTSTEVVWSRHFDEVFVFQAHVLASWLPLQFQKSPGVKYGQNRRELKGQSERQSTF